MTEHASETFSAFFQLAIDDNNTIALKTKINVVRVKPRSSMNQT